MHKQLLTELGPQENVISLKQAQQFIGYWKQFINKLYSGQDKNMPHGIFIPIEDIMELAKLKDKIKSLPGKDPKEDPIEIIGVRAYYCLKDEVGVSDPVSASEYPVEALLVPVYREPQDPVGITRDLVVPVTSKKDTIESGDNGDYSIYDITRPCPTLCDLSSPLH